MRKKAKRIFTGFLLLVGFGITGCATPNVRYGDPTALQTLSTEFSSSDLQQIAVAMVDSLLVFPPIAELTSQRRPVILVDLVRNKSMQHIDMEAVTDSIRARLIRSGKFRFIDRTTDAAAIKEIRIQQESGLVDRKTAARFGKQIGAEYLLTGNLAEIRQKSGNTRDVYYKFTLNLKNLNTGILEWSDEKEIRKVWDRSIFGG